MMSCMHRSRNSVVNKIFSVVLAAAFIFTTAFPPSLSSAQTIMNLPVPGTMIATTPAYTPAIIEGITIHPNDPFKFSFIVDTGDDNLQGKAFEEESTRLIKYFMASLTVPEEKIWVNLSPYEKDRIVPDEFGATEMGRDLLAQDYLLKQLTSSLIFPESDLGAKFWKRIYARAKAEFGTTDIPINTFNKVWIVPEKAKIYEHEKGAFILSSRLKVMLEEDYVALQKNKGIEKYGLDSLGEQEADSVSDISSAIVREILIPEIEREVNEGKTFANLRQIYNSLLLAGWYKNNLKESLLGQVYINKEKTAGVDIEDPEINQKIYDQYVEAFKKGVYNYIREDYDTETNQTIPRKYFSGGADLASADQVAAEGTTDEVNPGDVQNPAGRRTIVDADLKPEGEEGTEGPIQNTWITGSREATEQQQLAVEENAYSSLERIGNAHGIINSALDLEPQIKDYTEDEARQKELLFRINKAAIFHDNRIGGLDEADVVAVLGEDYRKKTEDIKRAILYNIRHAILIDSQNRPYLALAEMSPGDSNFIGVTASSGGFKHKPEPEEDGEWRSTYQQLAMIEGYMALGKDGYLAYIYKHLHEYALLHKINLKNGRRIENDHVIDIVDAADRKVIEAWKAKHKELVLAEWQSVKVPEKFSGVLARDHHLRTKSISVIPVKGDGNAEALLANPLTRYIVESASAAALGSFYLRGRGKKTKGGLDIKTAADVSSLRLIENETARFVQENPRYAVVDLASEGLRDGTKSSTIVGRVHYKGYRGGFVDTATIAYKDSGKGYVDSFDKILYIGLLDQLRRSGVQILYKVTDSLEKTEGLVNPDAKDNPTDSWAVNGFILDSGKGPYMLPIDDNFRTAGYSYHAPKKADIGPLDMPSVALPKIAEAHGLVKGTPEYDAFMNNTTVSLLGPRGFNLKDEDSSDSRHARFIADAIRFKQDNGYTGMRVEPVTDGDLIVRLMALAGPIPLNDNRNVIALGRSGSAEAQAARAFAKTVEGAHMVSRRVSTKATADRVSYETADGYTDEERETNRILGYSEDDLTAVTADEEEDVETITAMASVTGATDHLGTNFRDTLKRVAHDAANQTIITSELISDMKGNLYVVKVTYEPVEGAKLGDSVRSIVNLHPDSKAVAEELGDVIPSDFTAELGALDEVLAEEWSAEDPYEGQTFDSPVDKILAHPDFANEDPRVLAKMRKFFETGTLSGTGQLVILPIDQGLEHDVYRSHASNPAGADKWWQAAFAHRLGMSGYAAPLGTIKLVKPMYPNLPMIAKINNSVTSQAGPDKADMQSAMTANIAELAELGVEAVGFTIYGGSSAFDAQYEELRQVVAEAKKRGMAVVVWSYPRGGRDAEGNPMPSKQETALDVTIAAVKLAVRAGANIVKIKPPANVFRNEEKRAWIESQDWFKEAGYDLENLSDRIAVVRKLTNGRVQIFSGGPAKVGAVNEIAELVWGGIGGDIIGRNSFKPEFAKGKKFVLSVIALNLAKAERDKGRDFADIEEFKAYAFEKILPELEAVAPDALENYGPDYDIAGNSLGVEYEDEVARMLAEEFAAEGKMLKDNLETIYRWGALAGTGKLFIAPYNKKVPVEGASAYTVVAADVADVIEALNATKTPIIAKITSTPYTGGDAADYANPAILGRIGELDRLGVKALSYELNIDKGPAYLAQMTELRAIMTQAKKYGLPTVVQAYPTGDKQDAFDRVTASAHIAFEAGAHIIIIRQPSEELFDAKNTTAELDEKQQIPHATLAERMGLIKWYALSGARRKTTVTLQGGNILEDLAATLVGGNDGVNLDQIPKDETIVPKIVAMLQASAEGTDTVDRLMEAAAAVAVSGSDRAMSGLAERTGSEAAVKDLFYAKTLDIDYQNTTERHNDLKVTQVGARIIPLSSGAPTIEYLFVGEDGMGRRYVEREATASGASAGVREAFFFFDGKIAKKGFSIITDEILQYVYGDISREEAITKMLRDIFGDKYENEEQAVESLKKANKGKGVRIALWIAEKVVMPELKKAVESGKVDFADRYSVDDFIIEFDQQLGGDLYQKTALSGNNTTAITSAAAKLGAKLNGLDTEEFLSYGYDPKTRTVDPDQEWDIVHPESVLIEGGAHGNWATTWQEIMQMMYLNPEEKKLDGLAPQFRSLLDKLDELTIEVERLVTADGESMATGLEAAYVVTKVKSTLKPIDYVLRAALNIGLVPGEDFAIAIDAAASEFYHKANDPKDPGYKYTGYYYGVEGRYGTKFQIVTPEGNPKELGRLTMVNVPGQKSQRFLHLTSDEQFELVRYLTTRKDDPLPIGLWEDLFGEFDLAGNRKLTELLYALVESNGFPFEFQNQDGVVHIADDMTTTRHDLFEAGIDGGTVEIGQGEGREELTFEKDTVDGGLIKLNQVGTLKQTMEMTAYLRSRGRSVSHSHRGQDTHAGTIRGSVAVASTTYPTKPHDVTGVKPKIFIKYGTNRNIRAVALQEILEAYERIDAKRAARKAEKTPGGINLNPSLVNFEVKKDGNGVILQVSEQPIMYMNINGFVPVIINVTPVTNLPFILGMGDAEKEKEEYGSLDLEPADKLEMAEVI